MQYFIPFFIFLLSYLLVVSSVVVRMMASGDSEEIVADGENTTLVVPIIVGLSLLLNLLLIFLPSVVLNGCIVLTFVRTKSLHTPSNLLSVNISVSVLVFACVYWPVSIFSIQKAVVSCDCTLRYVQWILAYIFRLTLYSLNFMALAVGYFVIFKYGFRSLTNSLVIIVIACLWIVSLVSNVPLICLVPVQNFASSCEEVCLSDNASIFMNGTSSHVPSFMNLSLLIYIIIRNMLFTVLPIFTVAGLTGASYFIFKKSVINPSSSLSKRLLLLPFLMTTTLFVFVLSLEAINWHPMSLYSSSMKEENLPIDFAVYLVLLLWDIDGIVYACLILYFNVALRRIIVNYVRKTIRKLFCKAKTSSNKDSQVWNEDQQSRIHTAESTLHMECASLSSNWTYWRKSTSIISTYGCVYALDADDFIILHDCLFVSCMWLYTDWKWISCVYAYLHMKYMYA